MQELWISSLGWEDPLEKEIAIYTNIFAWGNPMDKGAWWATVHGAAKFRYDWVTKQQQIANSNSNNMYFYRVSQIQS